MKIIIRVLVAVLLLISCSKDEETVLSSDAELLSFSIKEMDADFEILSTNEVVTMLENEENLKDLTAIFKVSNQAKVYVNNELQTSGYTKNNFYEEVIYVVEAEDGTKNSYEISIKTEPNLISFRIKELEDTTFEIQGSEVLAQVSSNTNLENLTAEFKLTENAEFYVNQSLQVSGETKQNFNETVNYDLSVEDETVKTYKVVITKAENIKPVANAGEDKVVVLPENNNTVSVILDGSESTDEDGIITDYLWKQDGVNVGNEAKIEIELAVGIYNFELEVIDDQQARAVSDITIEVRNQGIYLPIDGNATYETKQLYNKIAALANGSQFVFGQEFPMSFKLNGLRSDLSTSDCKEVIGEHPGVFGIDPHYMLYKTDQQRELHIQEAQYAYNNGAIVTFDFHQQSRHDNKIYYDDLSSDKDKSLMYDIVNNIDGSQEWFYSELDEVISIINNDLGFPVVFRLYHEMDGNWFWWGTQTANHSPELYKQFYKLATEYIKNRSNLVLFGWTPNQQIDENYYPGDMFVDVVGVDVYDPTKSNLKSSLIELSNFTLNHGKVAVLSETGRIGYVNSNPTFWTSNVLAAINEGASDIRIAWALAWFNAPWETSQNHLFIPDINSDSKVKGDFVSFYNHERSLFLDDIKKLEIYN